MSSAQVKLLVAKGYIVRYYMFCIHPSCLKSYQVIFPRLHIWHTQLNWGGGGGGGGGGEAAQLNCLKSWNQIDNVFEKKCDAVHFSMCLHLLFPYQCSYKSTYHHNLIKWPFFRNIKHHLACSCDLLLIKISSVHVKIGILWLWAHRNLKEIAKCIFYWPLFSDSYCNGHIRSQ